MALSCRHSSSRSCLYTVKRLRPRVCALRVMTFCHLHSINRSVSLCGNCTVSLPSRQCFAAAGFRERWSPSSATLCSRPQPQRVSICIRYTFELRTDVQRRESGRRDQEQSRHSTEGKAGYSIGDMASGTSTAYPLDYTLLFSTDNLLLVPHK